MFLENPNVAWKNARRVLPGSQIAVDKVQRFQITHSRGDLCGKIQQTLETIKKKKHYNPIKDQNRYKLTST